MKILIKNNRIIGLASDEYEGPEQYIPAPEDFDPSKLEFYALVDGGLVLLEPPAPDIQTSIVQATQDRLDTFARTRNYDGILSAATYATSTVPKFASEGQYAVQARDMTWATLYQILEEVQAGTRPVPESFADVEFDLPVLEWPVIVQPEPAPEPAPEPEPTPEEPV